MAADCTGNRKTARTDKKHPDYCPGPKTCTDAIWGNQNEKSTPHEREKQIIHQQRFLTLIPLHLMECPPGNDQHDKWWPRKAKWTVVTWFNGSYDKQKSMYLSAGYVLWITKTLKQGDFCWHWWISREISKRFAILMAVYYMGCNYVLPETSCIFHQWHSSTWLGTN